MTCENVTHSDRVLYIHMNITLHVRERRALTMGRCAERILNTKWTERRRTAYTRDIQAKNKAANLWVISPEKSPYTDTAESIGLQVKKDQWHSASISTCSSHVYHGHSDRAPDVACSFYVAAHLSCCSSSPSPPLHTAKHLGSTAHPLHPPDPRRTEQKSYRFIITTVTCPHFCLWKNRRRNLSYLCNIWVAHRLPWPPHVAY